MSAGQMKIKNMKTYIEDEYTIAYKKARKELGSELIMIERENVKVGGFFGLFSKKKVKVTFGIEDVPKKKFKQEKDSANKEVIELLKSMGYMDSNNNVIKGKVETSITTNENNSLNNIGIYNPYKNNVQNINNINKQEEKIEDVKEKIKKELTEELKKEIFKEGIAKEEVVTKNKDKDELLKILRDSEISEEYCDEIVEYFVKNEFNSTNYKKGLIKYFYENILTNGGIKDEKFIMLVGPTGVGKTTSCAKIIANYWNSGEDVAFITSDNYRLEAVSQLKAYANIMRVPVEVIKKSDELKNAIEKFKEKKLVLMDTAGRSPKNTEQIKELEEYVTKNNGKMAVYLVLSATSKLSVMVDTIEKFKYLNFSSIIFTKLDETTNIGALLTVSKKYNIAISYITTGQKVPDDIEVASNDRLAKIFSEELD
ncbi:AAA family ATPase [Haliovirga abyssi]|uniref:Flagellar biosynthesis protein FlhF n=1 Tax=Haliovirga abyssi TaxID=2996794 RepID=A0AAU9DSS8_9FUSO|nr:AAA family ATPase [Haliovirga abyssi]BDU50124.1 flagellar biosynthesis regulator FlhF [Haliovirga abyssi]